MAASTTSTSVQTVIDGRVISLLLDREGLSATTLLKLQGSLLGLNGVSNVNSNGRSGFILGVINAEFFSVRTVARQAKALAEDLLGVRQPSNVIVKLRSGDYDFSSVLETNRSHDDTDLLDELGKQLGLQQLGFSDGYNITFDGDITPGLAERMAQVIDDFYDGTVAQPPLDYVRLDEPGSDYFRWLLNRRFTNEEVDLLTSYITGQVPGVGQLFVDNNNHRITGKPVNSLFPKNRTAYLVVQAAEEFLDQQAVKAAEEQKAAVDAATAARIREEINRLAQSLGAAAVNGSREEYDSRD